MVAPNQCQALGAASSGVFSLAPNPGLARSSTKRGWWDQGWAEGDAAASTRVPSGCPCRLPGKARPWRTALKQGDSPSIQLLGTLAYPEMGRSRLSLQVRNQPGRNIHATCGWFPMAAGERCSPSPAGGGVRPQNLPSRGLWEPTRVQPSRLTHSPHVPRR